MTAENEIETKTKKPISKILLVGFSFSLPILLLCVTWLITFIISILFLIALIILPLYILKSKRKKQQKIEVKKEPDLLSHVNRENAWWKND